MVDVLVQKGILFIPTDELGEIKKSDFDSADRAVRRYLESCGYEGGRRTGNLVHKKSVVLQKEKYLLEFFANRSLPPDTRLREVMIGESYIHQHYHRSDDSLFDPSDEQDVQLSK